MSWQDILKQKPPVPNMNPSRDKLIGIPKLPLQLDFKNFMDEEEMGKMNDQTAQKIITWLKNTKLNNLNVNVGELRTENGENISTMSFDNKVAGMTSPTNKTNIDGYSVTAEDLVWDQQKKSRTSGYKSVVSPQLVFNFLIEKDGKDIFYFSVKKNSWDAHSIDIDWRKRL